MKNQAQRLALVFAFPLVLPLAFSFAGCAGKKSKELTKTESARMILDIAAGAINEKDPTDALEKIQFAESLDPSLPEIPFLKSLAFEQKNDLSRATIEIKKALTLNPKSSAVNAQLGKLMLEQGHPADAVRPLTQAANDPLYREAYRARTNLGILHYRRGELDLAAKHMKRAVTENPLMSCMAHYYLGHIALKAGKFDEAIRSYDRSTRSICGGFADGHYALGVAYQRSRKIEDARKKFLSVQQQFPRTAAAERSLDHLRELQ
ncbi:MAG: tetratricopeptide repeat protein [Bdellovibrionales bacterium]|nr:tetratricopeptide repeat protein [Bdellovibrionales bacterium]